MNTDGTFLDVLGSELDANELAGNYALSGVPLYSLFGCR